MSILPIIEKSHDWSTFKRLLEYLSSKEKGDAFEAFVKLYLTYDPIYATELRHVWLLKEVPSKIREYLNLPVRDMGIDIIVETYEGKYWAVQCKYRTSIEGTLNWKQDISTFAGLAFSVCRNISFGLICTTGEKYSRLLDNQDNIGICTSEVWDTLDSNFFDVIRAALVGKVSTRERFKPRPHQERAISKAKTYFSDPVNSRGKLIMPCGTGKSLTAHWIAQSLNAKTILVVVPSLLLLRHTLGIWAEGYSRQDEKLQWICVCSDEGVREVNTDETIAHSQDMGIPCVTEVGGIVNWFESTRDAPIRVVFTTYQSGKAIASASRKANISYDLAVFDEAHRTVGHIEKNFSHLLFDKNISVRKRLFMTATERRYLGKSNQMVSMEDNTIYGDAFEVLTFKEALEQVPSILSDYKILTLYITRSEINELVRKNKFVMPSRGNWNSELESAMLASLAAVKKAMQKYPIKHVVSFHSTVARAKAFKENAEIFTSTFPEYGELTAYHVSGSDPVSTRERILADFVGSPKSLITNARCLTEGVDIPSIDSVLFADPKQSKVDIVQAVGRALRPAPSKEFGYIIIPVIVDLDEELNEIWKTDSFEALLTTLKALAANDERVIDYFRGVASGKQTGGLVSHFFSDNVKMVESIDVENFISSVNLRCWDSLTKLSHWSFSKARSFVRRLHLEDELAWKFYCDDNLIGLGSIPEGLPRNPEEIYGDEWQGWSDWLGGVSKRRYAKYSAARDYIQSLGISSKSEWELYVSGNSKLGVRPGVVPPNPESIYRSYREWKSWIDWLGISSDSLAHQSNLSGYLSFEEARKIVHALGIRSRKKFRAELRIGDGSMIGIPPNPEFVYPDQWKDWGDWLDPQKRTYRTFKNAREFARSLNLKDRTEWSRYRNDEGRTFPMPNDIPYSPDRTYRNEWQGWQNWLREPEPTLPFNLARVFVRKLGLKNKGEWRKYSLDKIGGYSERPSFIPLHPSQVYRNEWKGWNDWLGIS